MHFYIKANLRLCNGLLLILRECMRPEHSLQFSLSCLWSQQDEDMVMLVSHTHKHLSLLEALCPYQFPLNFLSFSQRVPPPSSLLPPVSGGPWALRFEGLDNQACLMVHNPLILQGRKLQKTSTSTPEVCELTYTLTLASSFSFLKLQKHHTKSPTHTFCKISFSQRLYFAIVSSVSLSCYPVCFPICSDYLQGMLYSCFCFYQDPPFRPSQSQSALAESLSNSPITLQTPSEWRNRHKLSILFVTHTEWRPHACDVAPAVKKSGNEVGDSGPT